MHRRTRRLVLDLPILFRIVVTVMVCNIRTIELVLKLVILDYFHV